MDMPNGFTIDSLMRRWKKAQDNHREFEELYRDALDYTNPNRQGYTQQIQGSKRTEKIFDSTAVNGTGQFANRIISALMPAWSNFIEFEAGADIPESEQGMLEEALETLTDKFFQELNQSNFYTEIASSMQDLCIGTGAILIEEEEFGKQAMFKCQAIPLHELYPEKPASGAIDSTWRKQMIQPNHIKQAWPEAELGKKLADLVEKEDSADVEILNAMLYNDKDGKYHQFVIHEPEKTVLFHQVFDSKRLIVFRWSTTAGEVLGRGPAVNVLADIKTLNMICKLTLQNAAMQMSGVYTGVDDGIFNPFTARIAPGVIIPVSSNASANPSLRPLDRSGDLGIADYIKKDLVQNIRNAFFIGQLGEITDPTKSATEIMIRQQEMLKDQGANFGRVKSELINYLVDAITDIMRINGKWPEYKVDGKIISIVHQSPIAKAEKLEAFQSIQAWHSDLQSLIPPEQLGVRIKLEDYPKVTQEMLGIPVRLIRTDDETKQKMQELQEQQAAMMQQQAPV